MIIWLEKEAWKEGYLAATTGKPNACPYPADDPKSLAWNSGYTQGKVNPGSLSQTIPLRREPGQPEE